MCHGYGHSNGSCGNLSIVALLANVALLPMVPSAMLFGAIALAGRVMWLPLGQWLALPAYLFLAWLTEGARLFATLPYAAVQLPSFPLWLLLGYYAIVASGWLSSVAVGAAAPGSGATGISDFSRRGGAEYSHTAV